MDQNFYIKLLKNLKACMTPLHGDTVDELIKYWEERHEWKMAAEEYISDISFYREMNRYREDIQ